MTTFSDLAEDVRAKVGRADSINADGLLVRSIKEAIGYLEKNFEFPYLQTFRQYQVQDSATEGVEAIQSIEARRLKNVVQAWIKDGSTNGNTIWRPLQKVTSIQNKVEGVNDSIVSGYAPGAYWIDTSSARNIRFVFIPIRIQAGQIFRVLMNEYSVPSVQDQRPSPNVDTTNWRPITDQPDSAEINKFFGWREDIPYEAGTQVRWRNIVYEAINSIIVNTGDTIETHPLLNYGYALLSYRTCMIIAATLRDMDLMRMYSGLYDTELQAMNRVLQGDKSKPPRIGEGTYNTGTYINGDVGDGNIFQTFLVNGRGATINPGEFNVNLGDVGFAQ